MKLKHSIRAGALMLALSMVLAGCSDKDENQSATSETSSPEGAETSETATAETADPYAYLATFSFSDGFGESGYLKGGQGTGLRHSARGLQFPDPARRHRYRDR